MEDFCRDSFRNVKIYRQTPLSYIVYPILYLYIIVLYQSDNGDNKQDQIDIVKMTISPQSVVVN